MTMPTELALREWETKKVVVQAMGPWDGTAAGATPIIDWVLNNGGTARYDSAHILQSSDAPDQEVPARLVIDTLEGPHDAAPGDHIIRGLLGEFYPCKPAALEGKYVQHVPPPGLPDQIGSLIRVEFPIQGDADSPSGRGTSELVLTWPPMSQSHNWQRRSNALPVWMDTFTHSTFDPDWIEAQTDWIVTVLWTPERMNPPAGVAWPVEQPTISAGDMG